MATPLSFLLLILSCLTVASAGTIVVNFGRVVDYLPSAFSLLKANDLASTNIKVVVNLPNENLTSAASHPDFALSLVQCNAASYFPSTQIQTVTVGNEVFVDPGNLSSYLTPAIQNIHSALIRLKQDSAVKISSPVDLSSLQSSYPSSSGSLELTLPRA